LLAVRAAHPVFRSATFFTGAARNGTEQPDVAWFRPDGAQLTDRDWSDGGLRTLGMLLNGAAVTRHGPRGKAMRDDSFLLVLHAGANVVDFHLPSTIDGGRYRTVAGHRRRTRRAPPEAAAGEVVRLVPNSAVLLQVIDLTT